MASFICRQRILAAKNVLLKFSRNEQTGYMVLLPEIGEDLPDKNPLLNEETLLPEFNSLTTEKCIPAIGKQSAEVQHEVRSIEAKLKSSDKFKIVEDVLNPLERVSVPLLTSMGICQILYSCNQSLMPKNCFDNIDKRIRVVETSKHGSIPIYEACKKALAQDDDKTTNKDSKLSTEDRRVVEKYVIGGRLNGLDLTGFKRENFESVMKKQYDAQCQFEFNLNYAIDNYKHKITDPTKMREFPEDFLRRIASNPQQWKEGPWEITLYPEVVRKFLEYCPDSHHRFNIWITDRTKASGYGMKEIENSSHVSGITNHREYWVKELGYKDYLDAYWCVKMIGNRQNLDDFLKSLLERGYPHQVQEIERLAKFSVENGEISKLEYWDVPYWARRQKAALYNYTDESLRAYFPFPRVLENCFSVIRDVFNVDIREQQVTEEMVWHKNVKFFDVFDMDYSKTEPMGSFYLDPYSFKSKFEKDLVLRIRGNSNICGVKPLSSVILRNPMPREERPSLLTLDDVKELFRSIGYVLQQTLTKVKRSDLAGGANVDRDTRWVAHHVLEQWVYEPEVLKSMGQHWQTGETLSEEYISNIIASRTHMAGFKLCEELYLSRFDIDVHVVKKKWEKIMKQLWKEHFVFPEHKRDSHICSMYDIFVGDKEGTYYGGLYSRMLAADIYSAFKETPQQDVNQNDVTNDKEHQRIVGKRYKDTYLALGGSVPGMEVFRRFRGRDPSMKAFFRELGMN